MPYPQGTIQVPNKTFSAGVAAELVPAKAGQIPVLLSITAECGNTKGTGTVQNHTSTGTNPLILTPAANSGRVMGYNDTPLFKGVVGEAIDFLGAGSDWNVSAVTAAYVPV